MAGRNVFIAGGTGYLGRCLIPRLVECGHHVCALVRPQSQRRLLAGCTPVVGIALDRKSYESAIGPADTFVQLVGVSHPSPTKAAQFESIDLGAGREAVGAAVSAGVQPFVYVSVSHPAPIMKAYIEVRARCEGLIRQARLNATIFRPWYVLAQAIAGPMRCCLPVGYWRGYRPLRRAHAVSGWLP